MLSNKVVCVEGTVEISGFDLLMASTHLELALFVYEVFIRFAVIHANVFAKATVAQYHAESIVVNCSC